MIIGIDVSEHNGIPDWRGIADWGVRFAMVRLGYGRGHLDERFYQNINGALDAGLMVGAYYYSYALEEAEAAEEASFMAHVLTDAGLTADKLLMDCWLDMEDADGDKERYGIRDDRVITGMCRTFLEEMNSHGYPCGIYASYDWLTGCIHVDELPDHTAYWCAQWGHHCDFAKAAVWQYTDRLEIGQRIFDGNLLLAEGRSFP